jgi:non-specific serine/threonine protein kinase
VKNLKASARIAMTGTSVENRSSDLWSLFDFLNPGLLGSAKRFTELVKQMESG